MIRQVTLFFILSLIVLLSCSVHASENNLPPYLQEYVIDITDETAHRLDSGNWLVDIYATWCGHCRQFQTTIQAVAQLLYDHREDPSFQDTRIAMINGPENPVLSDTYAPTGYPSVLNAKDGIITAYRGIRTPEAILAHLRFMANAPVSRLANAQSIETLQGSHGVWENPFIYIGFDGKSNKMFQDVSKKFQSQGHFYSPLGYTDEQSHSLAQSIAEQYPGDVEKQLELLTNAQFLSLADLVDHFGLTNEELPVIINCPLGRDMTIFRGPFITNDIQEWIEDNIAPPVVQLTPYTYPIVLSSSYYLLMAIGANNHTQIKPLNLLPHLNENHIFDHVAWTLSPVIPQLMQQFHITASNFVLIVNNDQGQFWVFDEDFATDPISLINWVQAVKSGEIKGKSLYEWYDIASHLQRFIQRTTDTIMSSKRNLFAAVGIISLFIGLLAGLLFTCICMQDAQTQIKRIRAERKTLQRNIAIQDFQQRAIEELPSGTTPKQREEFVAAKLAQWEANYEQNDQKSAPAKLAQQNAEVQAALSGNNPAIAQKKAKLEQHNAEMQAALSGNNPAVAKQKAKLAQQNAEVQAALSGNNPAVAQQKAKLDQHNAEMQAALLNETSGVQRRR